MMGSLVRSALLLLVLFTLITGIAYPAAVTFLANAFFPDQAKGSLIRQGDRIVGSSLIGQAFADPGYFWGRPSATGPHPYNAAASTGSNQGPSNPALHDAVTARIAALRAADPGNSTPVPIDLVTASGSGLDPHVSPEAAFFQARRVARARGIPEERVFELVATHLEEPTLIFLGDPRVNVLLLNLALDEIAPRSASSTMQ
jgi:K+-transporting ATPase ATPase C chain